MAGDEARVSIIDQTSGKKWSVILPTNVLVSQLRPALVRQLGLPTEDSRGTSIQYLLAVDGESGATRLGEDETLSAAGVLDGAVLRIQPVMWAGCFPAGVRITLPGGEHVPIESMRVSNHVLSRGPATTGSASRIVEIYRGVEHRLLVINSVLRVTPSHLIYVHGVGWQRAAALRPGDWLQHESGRLVAVESIVAEDGEFVVYNLSLSDNATFFAEGFLVHNFKSKLFEELRYDRTAQVRPEAEIDLAKIMITEALLAIQRHLVGEGWSLGGKRTIAPGEVQHARRLASGGGTLDLYVLVTPARALLQLFVAGARPDCRLGLYKYLLALNGPATTRLARWTTDAHDQVFVGLESSAEGIQAGVETLLAEFDHYGAEAAALAQDPRLADLVLQYGRWDVPSSSVA
jgi:hypothetical protein